MATICYEEEGVCEVYIYYDPYMRSKNKFMFRPIDKSRSEEAKASGIILSKDPYYKSTALEAFRELKDLESEGYIIPFKVKAEILEKANQEKNENEQ